MFAAERQGLVKIQVQAGGMVLVPLQEQRAVVDVLVSQQPGQVPDDQGLLQLAVRLASTAS
ncbi:MAG: hypothetical protein ACI9WU_003286 [Myxococcota bacterium]